MPSGEHMRPDFVVPHESSLAPRLRVYAHDYGDTVPMYLVGSDVGRVRTARWIRDTCLWDGEPPPHAEAIVRHYRLGDQ
jgi:hypothetical protein